MTLKSGPNLGVLVDGALGEAHYTELMRLFRGLDGLVQIHVKSRSTTAQPASPADGDVYIVPTSATGAAWTGKDTQIARFSTTTAGWEFFVPKLGWQLRVEDELNSGRPKLYVFDGTAWQDDTATGGGGGPPTPTPTALPGYRDGLKMVRVSGTALTVTAGSAYVLGALDVVTVASDIAKTGLSLTASTWYHVYLFSNSGTPDIEIVSTAPAAPYSGNARSKTSDDSRRYIGSIKSDASGNIIAFTHNTDINHIAYAMNINTAPLHVLTTGTTVTPTVGSIDLSGAIPSTAHRASLYMENTSTNSSYVSVGNSDVGDPAANPLGYVRANAQQTAMYMISASQTMSYAFSAAPSSSKGFDVWVQGYYYER